MPMPMNTMRVTMTPCTILPTSPDKAPLRCPYCREALDSVAEVVVQCGVCRTPQHQVCWRDHGFRCAVFSCPGNRLGVNSAPLPPLVYFLAALLLGLLLAWLGPWLVFLPGR